MRFWPVLSGLGVQPVLPGVSLWYRWDSLCNWIYCWGRKNNMGPERRCVVRRPEKASEWKGIYTIFFTAYCSLDCGRNSSCFGFKTKLFTSTFFFYCWRYRENSPFSSFTYFSTSARNKCKSLIWIMTTVIIFWVLQMDSIKDIFSNIQENAFNAFSWC